MAMTMNGQVQLAASREVVWAKLNDPEVLKACVPGFEEAVFSGLAPRIGIRETRRILCDVVLSDDDVALARDGDDVRFPELTYDPGESKLVKVSAPIWLDVSAAMSSVSRPCSWARASAIEPAGTPILAATSSASASFRPVAGSMKTL